MNRDMLRKKKKKGVIKVDDKGWMIRERVLYTEYIFFLSFLVDLFFSYLQKAG
jgi:hypothetical protein